LSPLLAHLVDEVAGATTTDVVNRSLVLHQLGLALELLIEAEDSALLFAVHVASAATAGCEVTTWGWCLKSYSGCWTGGIRARCDILWVDMGDIASTATARVEVMSSRDGWVRLGDAVVARGHFFGCWWVMWLCGGCLSSVMMVYIVWKSLI